jgi:hypothetical protein
MTSRLFTGGGTRNYQERASRARAKAEELRARAETFINDHAREGMYMAAEELESLARFLEGLSGEVTPLGRRRRRDVTLKVDVVM